MRRAWLSAAAVALLAGPTALAFFSGGYFDESRAWAGLAAWACVVVAVAAGARLPRGRMTVVALVALAGFAAWTLLSILWAPVRGSAYHAGQIVFVYLGALLAAALVLRGDRLRAAEPALAAGIVIVIGYGLSARLLPGILHFARSVSAEGRLEQPLTYWNAMGELAALGFVLSVRLAGDSSRATWLRCAGAAAQAPLAVGLYISFSRGALFACGAGLVAVVALVGRREQLWAVLRSLGCGVLAAVSVAAFKGVTALSGPAVTRERQGAIALALIVVVSAAAGLAQLLLGRRESTGHLRMPPRTVWIATAVIVAGLVVAIVVGAHESSGGSQQLSSGATRLTSLQSNRYDYWGVALRAFASEPLHGVGAGGWAVDWLRWRKVGEFATDAHSLELQTLAELGIVGAALLLTFLGAVAFAARDAIRRGPAVAGAVAALVTYLAHSPLDWDWQMPALTLVAIVLAGTVLAEAGEPEVEAYSASAIRGASRRKIQTEKAQIAQ